MILYFTGTGNSMHMARELGDKLGDPVHNIVEMAKDPAKKKERQLELANSHNKRLGLVFPVYAWAAPEFVVKFLSTFEIPKGTYVYAVCLCGENVGNALESLGGLLKGKGVELSAGYSVVSPNNYIVMGKGDVDSMERQAALLAQIPVKAGHIAKAVDAREIDFTQVVKGPMPQFTTGVINKLFNRFGRSDKTYFADHKCTSCGYCSKICPVSNITMVNGDNQKAQPKWQGHCAMCTACLHTCPVQAVQYGKVTVDKGRYYNPYALGKSKS